MNKGLVFAAGCLVAWLIVGSPPALPCSLCGAQSGNRPTLRQDAALAKLILYGQLTNAKINAASDTGGTTDLHIEKTLRSDPWLGDKKLVELSRYVQVDAKSDRYIILCDIFKGKLDPFRGEPAKSAAAVEYVEKVLKLDPRDSTRALLFFFDYLDHSDALIAQDAYLEFAKATDAEIGRVASKLSADKLRKWLLDPQTPAYRLGLYGFLLGACGGDKDAALLRSLVEKTSERTTAALGGLMSGYIRLRRREGWDLTESMLRDTRRSFTERLAVISTIRFYHGWQPQETREQVLRCLKILACQGEMADMAFEDLRRWELWDLTKDVLEQYGKKTHSAPIVRRALVRYAVACPKPEARQFVAEVRRQDPQLVSDVEESLQFEKQK